MFVPKFTLLPDLIGNLTQIERLYGQLESLRLPKKLELNLERDNLIQSSYISNSIEGNPLSLPEVTNLLLDDRVPATRDEKEVKNYFDILKTLSANKKPTLTRQAVANIYNQLLTGVNDDIAGQIRNKRVVVGSYANIGGTSNVIIKHEPPFHARKEIEKHLDKLINWLNTDSQTQPILKVGIFHHQFVFLHPFVDGNGRTCRLVTAQILLNYGYHINKYFVLDDYYDIDRTQYSDMLNSADTGDKTQWLTYFTSGVKYSLQSALSRANTVLSRTKVENRPTPKEQEVLQLLSQRKQLTSSDVSSQFHVSRQQAHKLLTGLVNKGYVTKRGGTKGSYYILK